MRWDGGYESGDEVSQYYDNLVGKLIVWGDDRDTAIDRMIRALEEMRIEGIATTIPADLAILAPRRLPRRRALHQVGGGHARPHRRQRRRRRRRPTDDDDAEGAARRRRGGQRQALQREGVGARRAAWPWSPAAPAAPARARAGPPRRPAAARPGSGKVTVPMQGTIVKVLVEVGQAVEAGQPVCVLEAMKMENNIAADKAGTVTEIKVAPGPVGRLGRRHRRHRVDRLAGTRSAAPASGGRSGRGP